MAGTIKGLTIQFNGDTTKLDKALSRINSKTKNVNKALKEVNNTLKFNPNNVELLTQKQSLLRQKIEQTRQKVIDLKEAQKQLDASGVDKTSEEYQKVRREIVKAESQVKNFSKALKKVKAPQLKAIGNNMKTIGTRMAKMGGYASIAAAGLITVGKKLLEANSTQTQAEDKLTEIYKTRMGVNESAAKSTEKLASSIQAQGVIGDEVTLSGAQQLATFSKYPSTVNKLLPAMDNLLVQQKGYNASADDATNIANMMGKAMSGQTGALKRVGIAFSDSQGKVLKYGTEEEKASMLSKIITQNVGNMNKKFAETDEGKIAQAKNTLGDMAEQIGSALLPAIANIAKWISSNLLPKVQNLINFIKSHPLISKIVVAIAAVLAVAGPLLIFIGSLVTAIGAIVAVSAPVWGTIALVVAGIAALIAIGVLLYKNWDTIKAKAISVWNAIKTTILSVWGKIKAGVTTAVNAVKSVVLKIWNAIKTGTAPIW
ncbi:MAG: hypothetical protein WCS73_09610, partial [Lentisphaeria bacterium]